MGISSLNHIQRRNGCNCSRMMRIAEADQYYIFAVDADKYVNTKKI